MKEAIFRFPTEGTPVECSMIRSGHINETYLVTTDTGARYVLQRINRYVFPNIDALMNNVSKISRYLRSRGGKMAMISYMDTLDGRSYYDDGEGGAWRIYEFVPDSICLQRPETPEDFYESARGFGGFQNALCDFPAETLEETIKDFHNTPDRYRQFAEAVENDRAGRASAVQTEIGYARALREKACTLYSMLQRGELPVRATHNDTKMNNVLLDEHTRRAICVIDLDTVMPGLSAYDFGDAIRFGASTAAEDERDLSLVHIDLALFRAFTRGFIETCPAFTDRELEVLPLGAYTMTVENAIRFLADHLNGDVYYHIDREGQNLDRARTQFRLAQEMDAHWDELQQIVREEKARLGR